MKELRVPGLDGNSQIWDKQKAEGGKLSAQKILNHSFWKEVREEKLEIVLQQVKAASGLVRVNIPAVRKPKRMESKQSRKENRQAG